MDIFSSPFLGNTCVNNPSYSCYFCSSSRPCEMCDYVYEAFLFSQGFPDSVSSVHSSPAHLCCPLVQITEHRSLSWLRGKGLIKILMAGQRKPMPFHTSLMWRTACLKCHVINHWRGEFIFFCTRESNNGACYHASQAVKQPLAENTVQI